MFIIFFEMLRCLSVPAVSDKENYINTLIAEGTQDLAKIYAIMKNSGLIVPGAFDKN